LIIKIAQKKKGFKEGKKYETFDPFLLLTVFPVWLFELGGLHGRTRGQFLPTRPLYWQ
jgi:hypothetical protein